MSICSCHPNYGKEFYQNSRQLHDPFENGRLLPGHHHQNAAQQPAQLHLQHEEQPLIRRPLVRERERLATMDQLHEVVDILERRHPRFADQLTPREQRIDNARLGQLFRLPRLRELLESAGGAPRFPRMVGQALDMFWSSARPGPVAESMVLEHARRALEAAHSRSAHGPGLTAVSQPSERSSVETRSSRNI